MSTLLQALEKLSPERRVLYERLLAKGKWVAADVAQPAIPRRPRLGPAPLSFAQERMWFFHQLEPESPSYNLPWFLELSGCLDVPALRASLREIVRRHEVLRTVFVTAEDGRPAQAVQPLRDPEMPEIDLRGLPLERRRPEMRRLSLDLSRRPFDLVRGPVLRTSLVRLDATTQLFVLVMHHIATDGWSAGIFIRELTHVYTGVRAGTLSPLSEPPLQYADFAVWQRQWLEGEVLATQVDYWKEQLRGLPAVLELPTDRLRPAVQTLRGASIRFSWSASLVTPLRELGRQHEATLFMVLLAAFGLLLSCSSGQEDVAVGSPIANRRRVEVEDLIGFFVNTLVLRIDLGGDPDLRRLVGRVRETALGAYDHQDVPFERLVEVLQPSRDISHSPLFQVMFALQNMPVPAGEFAGLRVTPLDPDLGTAQFDITLTVTETGDGGLEGSLEYNTDLFDQPTALRMIGHMGTILRQMGERPEANLSAVELLTEAEHHQVRVEWNDVAMDHTGERQVQDLFAEQVARTPEAEAVVWPGGSMTYGELDRRANRLARQVRAAGAGCGARVGVCLPRSPELIVALLAVLKAGAAYIPLDPAYPADRLAFMLDDSGADLLLTAPSLTPELGQGERPVLLVGTVEGSPAPPDSDAVVESDATPDNLVYIIYTSGSTGRPKAVLIAQRSLAHHCLVIRERYGLGLGDRVLQFVSVSFDVAAQEIFPTLISGAAVVLRSDDLPDSINSFVRYIEAQRLSVLNIPTSYWQEWVLGLEAGARVPDSVRVLIVGTEQTLAERWREWLRRVGGRVRLINGYGPTEATIESTFYEPQPEGVALDRGVPIGRPFANSRAHVVDRFGRLLPIGVPGELLVTGEGLSWGYFRRPDLTAEKFVPDPFGPPGGRLYRTGDLARHRPDGNLDCLGRVDDQVKVRGFRVELGEIEAALATYPGLREAAVLAEEEKPGVRRLVAYIVAAAGPEPTVGDLRLFLQQRLPDYMVPSAFVLLPALPLSPNCKVDRRALRCAGGETAEIGVVYVAPRDDLEAAVAGVWREVLRAKRIGVHDNFFDLGGHSLLMVQVQSRLRGTLGVEVPLLDMFRYPTVGALAAHLGASGEPQSSSFEESYGRGEKRGAALRRRQQAPGGAR